jgi:hypothetical protein
MDMTAHFSDPLVMALKRELQTSERILWQSRRLPRIAGAGFGLYFFAIPWTAFALFWMTMAFQGVQSEIDSTGPIALAFPLFGLPFVAVGLGMLSLPFLPLLGADKTMFAITNERLIKLYLGGKLRTKSVELEKVGEIERSEARDGSGTLKVATGTRLSSKGRTRTVHFDIGVVPNVIEAEDRLREALERLETRQLSS